MDIEIGNKKIDFVIQGGKAIYPGYIENGRVLYFDFKGKSNLDVMKASAYDLSGNGVSGNLVGFGYIAGSGYENNALVFDKVDDTIVVPYTSLLNSTKINVSLAIKPNQFSGEQTLIGRNYVQNWDITINATGRVSARMNIGGTFYSGYINAPSDKPLNLNQWNTIVLDFDGATAKLLINGVLVATNSTATGDLGINTQSLYLGSRSGGGIYYGGAFGHALIYNRSLSPEEITHNYSIAKERYNL